MSPLNFLLILVKWLQNMNKLYIILMNTDLKNHLVFRASLGNIIPRITLHLVRLQFKKSHNCAHKLKKVLVYHYSNDFDFFDNAWLKKLHMWFNSFFTHSKIFFRRAIMALFWPFRFLKGPCRILIWCLCFQGMHEFKVIARPKYF